MRRRAFVAAGFGAAAAVAVGTSAAAAPARGGVGRTPGRTGADDVALAWFDATVAAVAASGVTVQVTNSRTWAAAWVAAARAARRSGRPGFQEAAVAAAVHGVLRPQASDAAGRDLDAALARTLEAQGGSKGATAGARAGADEARRILAERAADHLTPAEVNAPFPVPPAAPGVWRPTPPGFEAAVQYGQRNGVPFLLDRNDRFRPGPAPALDSARYRRHVDEVRAYGSATGSLRTPHQTEVARFWEQSSLAGWTGALRAAVAGQAHRPLAARAALIGAFHAVSVDAQIAVYEAKYTYTRWRPVTAIREGAIDPDPTWTTLTVTPRHPEYPSGHAGFAGAAERVLTAFTGRGPTAPVTLTSPSGVRLTYDRWQQLTQDNVDARVWEGVHFRYSDETGVEVGRSVADWGLRRVGDLLR
ncbi:vanadium-dependent haloperoxidase [Yinghuangia seranimata]|uniref:vanadium-dependent haloperoxidase n=1 Tax=Yinghuangia seranimata TaxID=408067 RepID=UPI00248C8626|nr:vanadium-dependent haloperoxidase [Yinghuangia seranimata]MDI2125568.1 vanadium-dependent haloperoxidase [Yinghuangia seranimata]